MRNVSLGERSNGIPAATQPGTGSPPVTTDRSRMRTKQAQSITKQDQITSAHAAQPPCPSRCSARASELGWRHPPSGRGQLCWGRVSGWGGSKAGSSPRAGQDPQLQGGDEPSPTCGNVPPGPHDAAASQAAAEKDTHPLRVPRHRRKELFKLFFQGKESSEASEMFKPHRQLSETHALRARRDRRGTAEDGEKKSKSAWSRSGAGSSTWASFVALSSHAGDTTGHCGMRQGPCRQILGYCRGRKTVLRRRYLGPAPGLHCGVHPNPTQTPPPVLLAPRKPPVASGTRLSSRFPACLGLCPSAQVPQSPPVHPRTRCKACQDLGLWQHPWWGSTHFTRTRGQRGKGHPALPTRHRGDQEGTSRATEPGGVGAELPQSPRCCSPALTSPMSSWPPSPPPPAPHQVASPRDWDAVSPLSCHSAAAHTRQPALGKGFTPVPSCLTPFICPFFSRKMKSYWRESSGGLRG